MKILIVDDNDFARFGTIDYLKLSDANIEVDQAENGQVAKEKISSNNYDLILLDISMPGISGMEVLKYIRENDKEVDVIITSVVSTEFQIRKAEEEGISDYLPKPIEMDKLMDWIDKIKQQKSK